MKFAFSAAVVVAVIAAAVSAAADPEPGYGKNFKNDHYNNAAAKKDANAAFKNNKYDNHEKVNQGFAYNQVKKNTHAKANAQKKDFDHAAVKNDKKKAHYNNFGFPGYKGKGYGVW